MSSEDQATSELSEPLPSDEREGSQEPGGNDPEYWRAETTRLRQELKKAKNLNSEAAPYVQLAMAVQAAPGGAEIIKRLQEGKPLTAAQEKKVEQAQQASGGSSADVEGLLEKIRETTREEMSALEQKLWERERAKEQVEKWHKRAAKDFPGYENLQGTPEWNRRLSVVINMIRQGAIEIPDDEPEPEYFAIKETWATLKKDHPELGKERPAKKSETERRAAISRTQTPSGTAPPEDEDQLPTWARLGTTAQAATGGRSFSSLPRGRK